MNLLAKTEACADRDVAVNAQRQRDFPTLSLVDDPITASEEGLPGETRVQSVIRRVVSHIREGKLKVGDQLPSELTFAQDYGVSRPVVREAFGALAALNIIEVANGRRPRVSAINASVMTMSLDHAVRTQQVSVQEVWEVRRNLEAQTASLAASRRTAAEAASILALAHRMREVAPGSPELVRLDIDFHNAIALASRNLLLTQIIASFEPLMERAVPVAWSTRQTAEQRENVLVRHMALAQAIADQDPAGAVLAMDQHFDRAITPLLDQDV
jgi:GntR family transcriptional repressor for pyruvate dehydrogenase complex